MSSKGAVGGGIDEDGIPMIDTCLADSWIYPVNMPERSYQYSITKQCLLKNTMVTLPTGLGKTFIAAVVMYNFYRWYPTGKVLFLAPTKPLVAQQVQACFRIMGFDREDVCEMTGSKSPAAREKLWQKKRVFFVTPQTLQNDLGRGTCPAKEAVCLIIDEAHRSLGNHAYCKVADSLYAHTDLMRIVALSATPGDKISTVQQIISNLRISHIELRSESSLDIQPYTNQRKVELVVVEPTEIIKSLREPLYKLMGEFLARLNRAGAISKLDPQRVTSFQLLNTRNMFRRSNRVANAKLRGQAEGDFAICISLAHSCELLNTHGIVPFYKSIMGYLSGEKNPRAGQQMQKNQEVMGMVERVKGIVEEGGGAFKGHPKLEKLEQVVTQHFRDTEYEDTRVIVFSSYRESVTDIAQVLQKHAPLIRVATFIGQASNKSKSTKGQKQSEQIAVVSDFRAGVYNTIVATCVGEEGLDIGHVDLIVCFDSKGSSTRLVQRMGRTGRKRNGRVVQLLNKGAELNNYRRSTASGVNIQQAIVNAARKFQFSSSPRMIPENIKLQARKLSILPNTCDWEPLSQDQPARARRRNSTKSTSGGCAPARGRRRRAAAGLQLEDSTDEDEDGDDEDGDDDDDDVGVAVAVGGGAASGGNAGRRRARLAVGNGRRLRHNPSARGADDDDDDDDGHVGADQSRHIRQQRCKGKRKVGGTRRRRRRAQPLELDLDHNSIGCDNKDDDSVDGEDEDDDSVLAAVLEDSRASHGGGCGGDGGDRTAASETNGCGSGGDGGLFTEVSPSRQHSAAQRHRKGEHARSKKRSPRSTSPRGRGSPRRAVATSPSRRRSENGATKTSPLRRGVAAHMAFADGRRSGGADGDWDGDNASPQKHISPLFSTTTTAAAAAATTTAAGSTSVEEDGEGAHNIGTPVAMEGAGSGEALAPIAAQMLSALGQSQHHNQEQRQWRQQGYRHQHQKQQQRKYYEEGQLAHTRHDRDACHAGTEQLGATRCQPASREQVLSLLPSLGALGTTGITSDAGRASMLGDKVDASNQQHQQTYVHVCSALVAWQQAVFEQALQEVTAEHSDAAHSGTTPEKRDSALAQAGAKGIARDNAFGAVHKADKAPTLVEVPLSTTATKDDADGDVDADAALRKALGLDGATDIQLLELLDSEEENEQEDLGEEQEDKGEEKEEIQDEEHQERGARGANVGELDHVIRTKDAMKERTSALTTTTAKTTEDVVMDDDGQGQEAGKENFQRQAQLTPTTSPERELSMRPHLEALLLDSDSEEEQHEQADTKNKDDLHVSMADATSAPRQGHAVEGRVNDKEDDFDDSFLDDAALLEEVERQEQALCIDALLDDSDSSSSNAGVDDDAADDSVAVWEDDDDRGGCSMSCAVRHTTEEQHSPAPADAGTVAVMQEDDEAEEVAQAMALALIDDFEEEEEEGGHDQEGETEEEERKDKQQQPPQQQQQILQPALNEQKVGAENHTKTSAATPAQGSSSAVVETPHAFADADTSGMGVASLLDMDSSEGEAAAPGTQPSVTADPQTPVTPKTPASDQPPKECTQVRGSTATTPSPVVVLGKGSRLRNNVLLEDTPSPSQHHVGAQARSRANVHGGNPSSPLTAATSAVHGEEAAEEDDDSPAKGRVVRRIAVSSDTSPEAHARHRRPTTADVAAAAACTASAVGTLPPSKRARIGGGRRDQQHGQQAQQQHRDGAVRRKPHRGHTSRPSSRAARYWLDDEAEDDEDKEGLEHERRIQREVRRQRKQRKKERRRERAGEKRARQKPGTTSGNLNALTALDAEDNADFEGHHAGILTAPEDSDEGSDDEDEDDAEIDVNRYDSQDSFIDDASSSQRAVRSNASQVTPKARTNGSSAVAGARPATHTPPPNTQGMVNIYRQSLLSPAVTRAQAAQRRHPGHLHARGDDGGAQAEDEGAEEEEVEVEVEVETDEEGEDVMERPGDDGSREGARGQHDSGALSQLCGNMRLSRAVPMHNLQRYMALAEQLATTGGRRPAKHTQNQHEKQTKQPRLSHRRARALFQEQQREDGAEDGRTGRGEGQRSVDASEFAGTFFGEADEDFVFGAEHGEEDEHADLGLDYDSYDEGDGFIVHDDEGEVEKGSEVGSRDQLAKEKVVVGKEKSTEKHQQPRRGQAKPVRKQRQQQQQQRQATVLRDGSAPAKSGAQKKRPLLLNRRRQREETIQQVQPTAEAKQKNGPQRQQQQQRQQQRRRRRQGQEPQVPLHMRRRQSADRKRTSEERVPCSMTKKSKTGSTHSASEHGMAARRAKAPASSSTSSKSAAGAAALRAENEANPHDGDDGDDDTNVDNLLESLKYRGRHAQVQAPLAADRDGAQQDAWLTKARQRQHTDKQHGAMAASTGNPNPLPCHKQQHQQQQASAKDIGLDNVGLHGPGSEAATRGNQHHSQLPGSSGILSPLRGRRRALNLSRKPAPPASTSTTTASSAGPPGAAQAAATNGNRQTASGDGTAQGQRPRQAGGKEEARGGVTSPATSNSGPASHGSGARAAKGAAKRTNQAAGEVPVKAKAKTASARPTLSKPQQSRRRKQAERGGPGAKRRTASAMNPEVRARLQGRRVTTGDAKASCIMANTQQMQSNGEVISLLRDKHHLELGVVSMEATAPSFVLSTRMAVLRLTQTDVIGWANKPLVRDRVLGGVGAFDRFYVVVEYLRDKDSRSKHRQQQELQVRHRYETHKPYHNHMAQLMHAKAIVLSSTSAVDTARLVAQLAQGEVGKGLALTRVFADACTASSHVQLMAKVLELSSGCGWLVANLLAMLQPDWDCISIMTAQDIMDCVGCKTWQADAIVSGMCHKFVPE